jgi:hypothetical protein
MGYLVKSVTYNVDFGYFMGVGAFFALLIQLVELLNEGIKIDPELGLKMNLSEQMNPKIARVMRKAERNNRSIRTASPTACGVMRVNRMRSTDHAGIRVNPSHIVWVQLSSSLFFLLPRLRESKRHIQPQFIIELGGTNH